MRYLYLRLERIYFVYIQHIIARAFRWSMEFGYLASCYKSHNINQQSIYLAQTSSTSTFTFPFISSCDPFQL
jgi:hypothetical protein